MIHYLNLSRGLLCAPHVQQPRLIRLQSTWCEQKRWADVLWTLDIDFYYALATGQSVTVHDVSEKPRITRACWQGLPFVQFTCEVLWGIDATPAPRRNGMDMVPYFTGELAAVDQRVRNYVAYFRRFHTGEPLDIRVCPGDALQRQAANTPDPIPDLSSAAAVLRRDLPAAALVGAATCRHEVVR